MLRFALLCITACLLIKTADCVSGEQTCGSGKVISRLINDESGNLKMTCVELNCTRIREEHEKCVPYAPTCEDDRWIRAIAKDDSGGLVVRCCSYSKITDLKRKDNLKSGESFKTEYVVDEKSETYYHEVVSNIRSNGDKTYELTTNHLKCVPPPGTTGIQPLNLNGPRGGTPRINNADGSVAVGAVCFPADSTVETPQGAVSMASLKVGDEVLVATDGGIHQFDKVSYFLHRDTELTTTFLELHTTNGSTLSMTPDHLIPVVACDFDVSRFRIIVNDYYRFAGEVSVGDCVLTRNQKNQFVSVESITEISSTVKQGVYAPVTGRSNLFVNGVLASCFSRTKETVLLRNYFDMIAGWADLLSGVLPSRFIERYLVHGNNCNECTQGQQEATNQFPELVQQMFAHLSLLLPSSSILSA